MNEKSEVGVTLSPESSVLMELQRQAAEIRLLSKSREMSICLTNLETAILWLSEHIRKDAERIHVPMAERAQ